MMRSVLQWLPLHYHLGNDDSPNNASNCFTTCC
ncbi:unnamed protein product, partial [Vitis vinifera]